ncbi:MAG: hypothetical protein PHX83_16465 [Acidobacteriia bacterium]|nr:hypothetical protein [Terriglobia bacterium]
MKKCVSVIFVALLLATGACRKAAAPSQDQQAVKQALENYWTQRKNINVKGMKIDYKNFQIAPDQATVDVTFQGTGSDDASIAFRYSLKKNANAWEVVKSEPIGGSMFGGHASGAPPAAGQPASGATELPPGHPAMAPSSPGSSNGMEAAHGSQTPKKK